MTSLTLTLHPASDGDAQILSWGPDHDRHHALIDLGRTASYRALKCHLTEIGTFDLFVITHIDADHIEGAVPLAAESVPPFRPADTWFNGHAHLATAQKRLNALEVFSVNQGEKLSDGIESFGWRWNGAFGGGPVSTDSPEAAQPLDIAGLRLTLLSPTDQTLSDLKPDWDQELAIAALRRGDPDEAAAPPKGLESFSTLNVAQLAAQQFKEDTATANGSSIAFLAEFGGKCVLMAADAHPGVLEARLAALGYGPHNRLKLDLLKLSHHGSKANTSASLLAVLDCTRFAISTDGSRHDFPRPETIARILVADPVRNKTFYFNYRQKHALLWDDPGRQSEWRYSLVMPKKGEAGMAINV